MITAIERIHVKRLRDLLSAAPLIEREDGTIDIVEVSPEARAAIKAELQRRGVQS
ncbi:hypothetical protein P6144_00180 [Sphingomonas sp. HITSZ_GF]|uniref:hypothetical protein n=1 Tax=Sphingomonas sp. HITSZ_GF TaxID=3037247 RepID=UPI00240E4B31|nr:hypothetical protein [Sphingomonas sp. HITSZ_GF]MDG2532052.1 hypothetical protein [Sphingomonas sp. HITSZ_GF]